MRINGANLWLRPLRRADHTALLATLEDWPNDQAGPVTAKRVNQYIDPWVDSNHEVTRPAVASGDFTETLMLGLNPQIPIGLVRYQVTNQDGIILTEAINQDYRGQGHASEAHILLFKYLFGTLNLRRIEFEVASWSPQISSVVAARSYITRGASRVCAHDANRIYTKHIVTAAAWATRKAQPMVANAAYTYTP